MDGLKDFFKAGWHALTRPWFLWTVLLIVLVLLVWFVGAYIPFLQERSWRLLIIVILVVLWGANNLRLQRKKHHLLNAETEPQSIEYTPEQAELVTQELQLGFRHAIRALPFFKVQQRPWYITLGSNQAGKTSSLLQSGLSFPAEMNQTKSDYATWRQSTVATFLDLAGGLAIHPKNKATLGTHAWQVLLRLIKSYRYKKAFAGVILSVNLDNLLNSNAEELAFEAYNLRSRLYELEIAMGFQCPIYVQITKTDILNGFKEFVDLLSSRDQQSSFGFSLPSNSKNNGIQYFAVQFDTLIDRLLKKTLFESASEKNPQKAAAATLFPCELQSIKSTLQTFLNALFENNQHHERGYLRGIFFVSSLFSGKTQQYLLQGYIRDFGLKLKLPNYLIKAKTSCFIQGFYQQFILNEKNVYRFSMPQYRYLVTRKSITVIIVLLILGAFSYVLDGSYTKNASRLQQLDNYAQEYLVFSKPNSVMETREETLVLLDKMTRVFEPASDPENMRLGLYQGDKVMAAVDAFYLPALQSRFLPELVDGLESVLKNPNTSLGDDYNYLRAYLMLDDNEHMDKAFLQNIMHTYWQKTYPHRDELRSVLENTLQDYLNQRTTTVPLDQHLIAQVRHKLRDIPPPTQVYYQIENHLEAGEFSIINSLPAGFGTIFDASSATQQVPAFFTLTSYEDVFDKYLDDEIASLDYANWVLGGQPAKPLSPDQKQILKQQVTHLYMSNYTAAWRKVLLSLQVLPFKNLSQAQTSLDILAQPHSPIQNFLDLLSKNTVLEAGDVDKPGGAVNTPKNIPTTSEIGQAKTDAKAMMAPANLGKTFKRLNKLVGGRTAVGTTFYEYNSLVLPPPAPATDAKDKPAETNNPANPAAPPKITGYVQIQTAFAALAKYLTTISNAADPDQAAYQLAVAHMKPEGAADPLSQLLIIANQMPDPIKTWLTTIADSTWQVILQMAAQYINRQWALDVEPNYSALIATYPFTKHAATEAEFGQVAAFVATGGTLEKFVQTYLKPFINTNSSPWQLISVGGTTLPIATSSVHKLYMWTQLRQVLFGKGDSKKINIPFTITPVELDNSAFIAELNVANKSVFVQHGPPQSENLIWPGEGDVNYANLEVTSINQSVSQLHKSGQWAWFKLLDSAAEIRTGSVNSLIIVKFVVADQVVIYSIKTEPPFNPFNLTQLRSLTLPNQL